MPGPDQIKAVQEHMIGKLKPTAFIRPVEEGAMEDQIQKHPRTVYLRFNFNLNVEDLGEQNGRDHRYRAVAADYPEVEAFGFTPEGALVACETRLNNWIREKLKEEARN